MTFDPQALRLAASQKSKAPQARAPGQRKGKKRPRGDMTGVARGPGEPSSRHPRGDAPEPMPTPVTVARASAVVVDLEEETAPPQARESDRGDKCTLLPDVVEKYREVELEEGVRTMQSLALKVSSCFPIIDRKIRTHAFLTSTCLH